MLFWEFLWSSFVVIVAKHCYIDVMSETTIVELHAVQLTGN